VTRSADLRQQFRSLHTDPPSAPTSGILVLGNPWDIGSAKILVTLGYRALATTSAGFAGSLGRNDQTITRDELIDHVSALSSAVDVPLSVDAEDGFAADLDGVATTFELLAATDAAGCSIEDYDPRADEIRSVDEAVERVRVARAAAADMVLTARAENHLRGVDDLDDTISRLIAYHRAGADVVYAPGLSSADDISRLVSAVEAPVNVLALPGTPPVVELASLGVARISVGSLFTWAAYGALTRAAMELIGPGTSEYASGLVPGEVRRAAFE
jgi:2-methylisocitrate lyase-like PEP mutase family enzyme